MKTVCAKHNISEPPYYPWKKKYGGMDVSEARRMRMLEDENARLRRLVSYLCVQNQILKGGELNKVVSPLSKRRAAEVSIKKGRAGISAACQALGLARATYYRRSEESAEKPGTDRGGESGASAVWVPACNSGSRAYWREGERETCAASTSSGGAIHVARSIRAVDVITVVEAAKARYGAPEHLRSDNSPEFIAYAVEGWLHRIGTKTM